MHHSLPCMPMYITLPKQQKQTHIFIPPFPLQHNHQHTDPLIHTLSIYLSILLSPSLSSSYPPTHPHSPALPLPHSHPQGGTLGARRAAESWGRCERTRRWPHSSGCPPLLGEPSESPWGSEGGTTPTCREGHIGIETSNFKKL